MVVDHSMPLCHFAAMKKNKKRKRRTRPPDGILMGYKYVVGVEAV